LDGQKFKEYFFIFNYFNLFDIIKRRNVQIKIDLTKVKIEFNWK